MPGNTHFIIIVTGSFFIAFFSIKKKPKKPSNYLQNYSNTIYNVCSKYEYDSLMRF